MGPKGETVELNDSRIGLNERTNFTTLMRNCNFNFQIGI